MTDAVTRIGGSTVNGLIAVWADSRDRRGRDQRELRRSAADDILSWLPELRDRLVRLELECDHDAWTAIMERAYASVRRVSQLMPRSWRHLRHSLFDAVGNGAGPVVWIDLMPSSAIGGLSYDYRWTMHAVEYLEYVQAKVQLWHQSFDQRKAQKISLHSYNDWLIQTDRWSPN